MTRPVDRLRAFAARWCCADTITRVVDPLIADLQHEHERAVRTGRVWQSRLIHVASWMAFFKVFAICVWRDDLAPRNWTSAERQAVVRTVTASVLLIIAITVLLEIPPAIVWRAPRGLRARLLLALIPQSLAITITFGATLGIVYGIGGRALSSRIRKGIVLLAFVASAFSLVNLGWITPAANQAFRVAWAARTDLSKGPPELTLVELRRAIASGKNEPTWPPVTYIYVREHSRYLQDLRLQYHSRWAMAFAPVRAGARLMSNRHDYTITPFWYTMV